MKNPASFDQAHQSIEALRQQWTRNPTGVVAVFAPDDRRLNFPRVASRVGALRSIDAFTVISAKEAERRFAVSEHVAYDYADYSNEQRVYEGGLHVPADLTSYPLADMAPNVIVDGDLVVDGSIDWSGDKSGCYFLITGSLRCKNLLVSDACFVVFGDVVVDHAIAGLPSDGDAYYIEVRGATRAKLVVGVRYFPMHFGARPDAIVCGDPEQYAFRGDDMPDEFPVDCDDSALGDRLVADILDDGGELDGAALRAALMAGRSVLR
jgi:hypothetical protein